MKKATNSDLFIRLVIAARKFESGRAAVLGMHWARWERKQEEKRIREIVRKMA